MAINFQLTGGGKAAITGDLVLLGTEVNPVLKTLRQHGIEVTVLSAISPTASAGRSAKGGVMAGGIGRLVLLTLVFSGELGEGGGARGLGMAAPPSRQCRSPRTDEIEKSRNATSCSIWRPREGNKEAAFRELRYGVSWVIVRQAFSMLRRKSSYLHAMFANATSATKMAVARRITSR